jgi:hypothetical protein
MRWSDNDITTLASYYAGQTPACSIWLPEQLLVTELCRAYYIAQIVGQEISILATGDSNNDC